MTWTGCDTADGNLCTVTMDADKSVAAAFACDPGYARSGASCVPEYDLTITATGPGTVVPASATYPQGTKVTVTASPVANAAVTWTGCDTMDGNLCTVTMDADKRVTATFACVFGEGLLSGTCVGCPTGCTATTCGGASVCKCLGASCPQLWARQGNCTATQATSCSGDTDGCGRKRYSNRCTTGSHSFGDQSRETCLYEHRDRNLWSCRHWTRTCRATVTEVGCVYTGVIPPILPPILGTSESGGYERGHLLPPFQCGSEPDTCRVEFDDETLVGAEGVEDRDDTDTEHRWACRSDTGEVRECRKAK